jgi:hypothetical protein
MRVVKLTGLAWLALAIAVLSGCGRQQPLEAAASGASASKQGLPFGTERNGIPPVGKLTPSSIPAGTAVVIRLQRTLSSTTSHAGDVFDAVLDSPLVVEGQTVVAEGAAVKGRVTASAKSSSRAQDFGYLRLSLVSLEVAGSQVPVQATSVFARGTKGKRGLMVVRGSATASGSKDVGFPADSRITFRLAQPLSLTGSPS